MAHIPSTAFASSQFSSIQENIGRKGYIVHKNPRYHNQKTHLQPPISLFCNCQLRLRQWMAFAQLPCGFYRILLLVMIFSCVLLPFDLFFLFCVLCYFVSVSWPRHQTFRQHLPVFDSRIWPMFCSFDLALSPALFVLVSNATLLPVAIILASFAKILELHYTPSMYGATLPFPVGAPETL